MDNLFFFKNLDRKRCFCLWVPRGLGESWTNQTSNHTHPPSRQQAAVGGSRASSKAYSRTLCQIMESGKRAPHTQTPPRSATGQVPAFHLAALLRVRRVVPMVQLVRLYGLPGAAQPSRWLLRTI